MEQENLKLGLVTESNAEYHGDLSAISKSRLAWFSVCPSYYKWRTENEQEPSEEMIVGSAFHKLVLENDTFGTEFIVCPQIDRRTKQGKEAYETFLSMAEGRQVLTEEQYQLITDMKAAVMQNEYAKVLLKGEHEKSMYGVDEFTGERIKTRPDCYREVQGRIVISDLKSCRSAISEDFCRDSIKFAYDLQSFMYCYNASKVLNVPMENIDFIFIAVQKSKPHLINIMQADEYMLQRGEASFRNFIGQYKECKQTGNFWGLNGKDGIINNLSLPSYLLKEVMKDN